jgi:iron complex transport system permease protein
LAHKSSIEAGAANTSRPQRIAVPKIAVPKIALPTGAAPKTAACTTAKPSPRNLAAWLLAILAALVIMAILGLIVGSKSMTPAAAFTGLFDHSNAENTLIVQTIRLPRTALALMIGAALGLAGCLMQAVTRNPLADPGLLGVNAGASVAVAVAIAVLGVTSFWGYLWFGLAGAAAASILVFAVAGSTRGSDAVLKLTLSGVAVTALLSGVTSAFTLVDPRAFDGMRFWAAGSVAGRDLGIVTAALPLLLLGMAIVVFISRGLTALSLGDEVAASLGAPVRRTRILAMIALTILCGTATAAAGPLAFVGLIVPHAVAFIVGPRTNLKLIFSALGGALLVTAADIVGRVIAQPAELQVGVVTALLGAPVLIVLVARHRK